MRLFIIPQTLQPQPEEKTFRDKIVNTTHDTAIFGLRAFTNAIISFGLAAASHLFEKETKTYLQVGAIVIGQGMILVNGIDFIVRGSARRINKYRKK